MPRKLFDHELEELVREMTDLGNTVDDRFEKTIESGLWVASNGIFLR